MTHDFDAFVIGLAATLSLTWLVTAIILRMSNRNRRRP